MKHNFKLKGVIIALVAISLCACEKSLVKSDYDYPINSENLPAGVTTNDADIYMTKARFSGNIDNTGNLADYGFIYCEADTFTKYGSVKAAMLAGAIPADNVLSCKDSNELIAISTALQKKKEYVCTTFAINYDGLTCGNEQLFSTDSLKYAPIVDLKGKTATQEQWAQAGWFFINKEGEGNNFLPSYNLKRPGANKEKGATGYESTIKKGPTILKRGNLMVLPGQIMGIDMRVDYLIYPTAITKEGCQHTFAIVVATDSITIDNCDDTSIVSIIDSMTFKFAGNQTEAPSDAERYVIRTAKIPMSYERKKVWIGIRHLDNSNPKVAKSLFVEEFKLY